MTLTTHIRFLDPIDPREVWSMATILVNAPKNFEVKHRSANSPLWEGCSVVDLNDCTPPPDAYVELCLDTPYSCSQGGHRTQITAVINWAAERGVRARWWQGECCPEWHHLVTPELEYAW
jgi:hypothetical protein